MQNNTFSTLFIGQNLIILKEVDSTNNYLKKLASNSEPLTEGTVIMAESQFAGRGQQQNVWHAEPGKNISASVYLKPTFLPINKQFYLNMAISLALKETLSTLINTEVTIKWPNDIFYKQQKIAGILIENTLTGTFIKSSVIGMGVNINQETFEDAIVAKAISVKNIIGKEVDLKIVIEKLCVFLEKYYLLLRSGNYNFLHRNYLDSLYMYRKSFCYKQNGHIFDGEIIDVEDTGILVVKTNNKTQRFNFKEIEFIHTSS